MRGWSHEQARRRTNFHLRSARARFGWSWITRASIRRSGRRSSRLQRKIGCTAQTLHEWVQEGRASTAASGPAFRPRMARAAQGAGAGEPRAAPGQRDPAQGVGVFCPGGARPPSASHDRLHRRSPRGARGRADLQGAADRPVDLPRPYRPARRSGQAARRGRARRRPEGRDPARLRGELRRLRRAQGLAAAAARGLRRRPLHRRRG